MSILPVDAFIIILLAGKDFYLIVLQIFAAYTFEANLTNEERAVVHVLCRKMGMTSKSSG